MSPPCNASPLGAFPRLKVGQMSTVRLTLATTLPPNVGLGSKRFKHLSACLRELTDTLTVSEDTGDAADEEWIAADLESLAALFSGLAGEPDCSPFIQQQARFHATLALDKRSFISKPVPPPAVAATGATATATATAIGVTVTGTASSSGPIGAAVSSPAIARTIATGTAITATTATATTACPHDNDRRFQESAQVTVSSVRSPLRVTILPAVQRHLLGLKTTFAYALAAANRGHSTLATDLNEQLNTIGPHTILDTNRLVHAWHDLPPFDSNTRPIYLEHGLCTAICDSYALDAAWILFLPLLPPDAHSLFPAWATLDCSNWPRFVAEYAVKISHLWDKRGCTGITNSRLLLFAASVAARDGCLKHATVFYSATLPHNPCFVKADNCAQLAATSQSHHKYTDQLCEPCRKIRRSLSSASCKANAKAMKNSTRPLAPLEDLLFNTPPASSTHATAATGKSPLSWEKHFLQNAYIALRDGNISESTHLGESLAQNLQHANLDDGRAVRYSKHLIAFYQCARYIGGWKANEFRRGPIYTGQGNKGGHLPVDASQLRNSEPARSTLQSHTPPDVLYPTLAEGLQRMKSVLTEAPASAKIGGISFDALYLAAGLRFISCRMVLAGCQSKEVGGIGAVAVKDVHLHTVDSLRADVGTQVEQFFYTSTDGKLSIPLGYVVQQGERGVALGEVVTRLVQELKEIGVIVHWTCSDGFTSSDDYVRYLRNWRAKNPSAPPVTHISDYQHLLKCIFRSAQSNVHQRADGVKFCAADLLNIRALAFAVGDDDHKALAGMLCDDVILPSDTMEWAPVKAMFKIVDQLRVVEKAGKLTDPRIACLAEYYEHMRCIYIAFSAKDKPWQDRLELLKEAETYFRAGKRGKKTGISSATLQHLKSTRVALSDMWTWLSTTAAPELVSAVHQQAWSHLSTLVVENFFSIVRAKHRYPDIEQYASTYRGAWNLLVYILSVETSGTDFIRCFGKVRLFLYLSCLIIYLQCYGNVEGISLSLERDFHMVGPREKHAYYCKIAAENQGGDDEEHKKKRETAENWARQLRPLHGLASVRDACKVGEEVAVGKLQRCPQGCAKMYRSGKPLEKHALTCSMPALYPRF